jgi:hypothetical protein
MQEAERLAAPDLAQILQRIKDVIFILGNFKQNRESTFVHCLLHCFAITVLMVFHLSAAVQLSIGICIVLLFDIVLVGC